MMLDSNSQPLIAVRIKDGIFVGNVVAAHDEDFLAMNKVTHVVNCAAIEIKDLFEMSGVHYLSFPWKDCTGSVCSTVMFDSGDRNIEQIVRFIDRALEGGECALIHSYYGASRSCAVAAAYCIVKYGWTLDSALAFMSLAHQDMNIKPYFLRQLRTFARRHEVALDVFSTEVDDSQFALDNDQLMLRNTYLNGLTADIQMRNELYSAAAAEIKLNEPNYKNAMKRRRRIVFCDTKQGTNISSSITQPVTTGRVSQHHDPLAAIERDRPGEADRPSILARRGSPVDRRIESTPDVNPKGRQVLLCRAPPQPSAAPIPEPYVVPTAAATDYGRNNGRQFNERVVSLASTVPQARPGRGPIRNPFMLSSAAGLVRTGSPLPRQRTFADRNSGGAQQSSAAQQRSLQAPSSIAELRGGHYDVTPASSGSGSGRLGRTIERVQRTQPAAPRASSPQQPFARTSSPMSRVAVTTHQQIPNAHSTITTLRGGSTIIRPYSAVPVGLTPQPYRAPSPTGLQRRTNSPQRGIREQQQPTARASSPMGRSSNSLAAQYFSGGVGGGGSSDLVSSRSSGVNTVRETNASILRRSVHAPISAARRT